MYFCPLDAGFARRQFFLSTETIMEDKNNKYRFAKKELFKIFIVVFALFVVSLSYYFYMRSDALHVAEKRAEVSLHNAERMILVRLGKIETAMNALQPLVEYALDDPDAMFDIAHHAMESSSRIMGSGIAFKEDYYPEKGHWYEVYVGHQAGSDTLIAVQVGSKEHDYFQMDWYKAGMSAEKGVWSNPYYDNAGGKSFMMSYAVPVHDNNGEVLGVIGADVTIDTLIRMLQTIKPYPHSFCTLTAGDGTVLVSPPASHRKKCHVFTESIDGKNMTLTLTVPDADMYRRLRMSSIFYVIMALTGIFSVFFIAYRSVQNLWKLNEVRIKEQHIEDELAIARDIQQSLLPSGAAASSIKKVDVCGLQIPAKYVGGDIYDYYVRGNKLFFCIGDVSGKGVPAALLMAISHSLFRTLSAHEESPEEIMKSFNATISDNNSDMMFITMFFGILDMTTGIVRYCNAGHNPPIIVRNGQPEYITTEPSLLMGIEPNATYTSHTLELAPGDSLFLYTDGLTEAENERKELFGEERALTVAASFGKLTAEEQVQKMRESMQLFVDHAEQSDDLTLLVIRRKEDNSIVTLTNQVNELERLEPFLEDFFQKNGLSMEILPKINLALEEALANVIMYAYPEGTQGEVSLSMKVEGKAIRMEIRDTGTPFNPLQQQEADLDVSLEERKIGGLGIHLIKEIMDSVAYEYREGCNVLELIFNTEVNTI